MRVRIKSAEEIRQYKKFNDYDNYSNNTDWLFIPSMFEYCGKIFTAKIYKYKRNNKTTYKLYDNKDKKISYYWQT